MPWNSFSITPNVMTTCVIPCDFSITLENDGYIWHFVTLKTLCINGNGSVCS